MALKPEELVLSAEEVSKVEEVEVAIDQRLKSNFVAGRTVIHVQLSAKMDEYSVNPRIKNELIRRYKAAGWKEVHFLMGSLGGTWKLTQ